MSRRVTKMSDDESRRQEEMSRDSRRDAADDSRAPRCNTITKRAYAAMPHCYAMPRATGELTSRGRAAKDARHTRDVRVSESYGERARRRNEAMMPRHDAEADSDIRQR